MGTVRLTVIKPGSKPRQSNSREGQAITLPPGQEAG